MNQRSEQDLAMWYGAMESKLGLSGSGFDGGGTPRPWDEARSAQAHGFHVGEDGDVYGLNTGLTGRRHRADIHRYERIERVVRQLPFETERLLRAAFDTCGASRFTSNYFSADCLAPLVGLAIVMWYEAKPDETRSPQLVVERWDTDLRSYESLQDEAGRRKQSETRRLAERVLAPIRRRTMAVYDECLGIYEEISLAMVRQRREDERARIAAIRSGT